VIGNKKAVMIAVLNQGAIRPELSTVLTELPLQDKYELHIYYPARKPIAQNRNMIVQNFLSRPQYDYLIMIDSDNVPPINLLNLVDYQKDIVGVFYCGFQKSMIIPFVMKAGKDGLYRVMDLNDKKGLVECDAVGTGVIVIKREVLEKVRHPFRNEYDADGIKLMGLDFNFCKRAKEQGFKVYAHLDYVTSHWVTMDLKDYYGVVWQLDQTQKELKEKDKEIDKLKQGKDNEI